MEKIKEKIKSITLKQWHIAVIVIGIIFVSLGAFHSNLWFDESYSVGLARHTFGEIWSIGGHDVHPILYYWMLRIVYLMTGGTIMAYRIFSVIPIAIMIILGYTHIRKDFGEKVGAIFSLLVYTFPVNLVYASEIRMYGWAMFFVMVMAIYAYRIFSNTFAGEGAFMFQQSKTTSGSSSNPITEGVIWQQLLLFFFQLICHICFVY